MNRMGELGPTQLPVLQRKPCVAALAGRLEPTAAALGGLGATGAALKLNPHRPARAPPGATARPIYKHRAGADAPGGCTPGSQRPASRAGQFPNSSRTVACGFFRSARHAAARGARRAPPGAARHRGGRSSQRTAFAALQIFIATQIRSGRNRVVIDHESWTGSLTCINLPYAPTRKTAGSTTESGNASRRRQSDAVMVKFAGEE